MTTIRVGRGLSCVLFAALALTTQGSLAQQPASKVERVEITGSIIRQRLEAETALPVTTITKDEIQRSGAMTTMDLVNNLALVSGGSFTEGTQIGSSALGGHSSAGLRGLGGKSTLILLNGRRLSNFAFQDPISDNSGTVDLNSIPLNAIERIEILRDGASATYGSDAVAGVINFILKTDYTGLEASLTYGETQKGGGGQKQFTLTGGFGNLAKEKWNVFANYSYTKNQRLTAADRDFSNSAYKPELGINRLSSRSNPANISIPPSISGGAQMPPQSPYSCPTGPRPVNGAILVGGLCRFDYAAFIDSLPMSEKEHFLARGTLEVSKALQLSAEALLTRNKYRLVISPDPIDGSFQLSGLPFVMPASSPYNPYGADAGLRWRTTELGGRTDNIKVDGERYVLGAKGTVVNNWDYDGTVGISKNKVADTLGGGWVSEERLRAGLLAGTINGFGNQPNAASMAALQGTQVFDEIRTSTATTKWVDVRVSNSELIRMPGGALQVGFGAEVRKEKLEDNPSPVLQTGDIIGQGGNLLPIQGSRDVKALFAEVNVPIVKNLEALASVRYDNYSDFGTTTNPKLGLRFQPFQSLLLRGSWGKGFRAPQLSQIYSQRVQTTGSSLDDPLRCPGGTALPGASQSTDCGNQFNEFTGGNPNLQPEKSESYTLGVTWAPVPSASVGLTYWNIKRKENISVLADNTILDNIGLFGQYVTRRPRTATDIANNLPGEIDHIDVLVANLGDTKTDGLDIEFNWQGRTESWGRLTFRSLSTWIWNYESQLVTKGPFLDFLEFPQKNQVQLQKWRHNAMLIWDKAPWSADVVFNYIGKYPDEGTDLNDNPRDVAAWWTLSVGGAYTWAKNTTLRLGVRNLFDRDPPFTNKGYGFAVGWDENTHDPRGRFYYVSLVHKFK